MTKIQAATLSAVLVAFSGLAAQAQNDTNYGTGTCTSGYGNSAFGYEALSLCTSSTSNDTGVGAGALQNNTSGGANVGVGTAALFNTSTGSNNTVVGEAALSANTTGGSNTAVGYISLLNSKTNSHNTAVGNQTLQSVVTGTGNIAIGDSAGFLVNFNTQNGGTLNNTTNNNIEIGNLGAAADNGVTRIGTEGTQKALFAAGAYGTNLTGGIPLVITSTGQIGVASSSIRYKQDVRDMSDASNGLFRLRPVTYHYKEAYAGGSKATEYGLVAEEVAAVYPDLVSRNADGVIETVQYQKLTPMLLNELQKQHLLIEKEASTIQMLEKRLAALEAGRSNTASLETKLAQ